ncbi:hypothetical protein SLA2020_392220 [Shorea laevis]
MLSPSARRAGRYRATILVAWRLSQSADSYLVEQRTWIEHSCRLLALVRCRGTRIGAHVAPTGVSRTDCRHLVSDKLKHGTSVSY